MDHRVDAGEQVRVGVVGIPLAFVAALCGAADQRDDAMAAGAQKRGQRRTDQSRRPGDGDGRRGQTVLGGQPVCGQIVGQLAVPVDEHRAQRRPGHRRFDPVDHPGPVVADVLEFVGVPPPHGDSCRQRGQAVAADGVDETPRRVVAVRLVLGDPAQAAGQREVGSPVLERGGLGDQPHRRPRRRQPVERARPGVPGEHVVARRVDHARILSPIVEVTHERGHAPGIGVMRAANGRAARARRWAAGAAVGARGAWPPGTPARSRRPPSANRSRR